jgi:hypothetical protein
MGRHSGPPRRRNPRYEAQPTTLVVCEDSKSGRDYVEDLKRHFRVHARVVHSGHTDPLGIVNHAIKASREYDQIFCVIDRDEHQRFDEALGLARPKNVAVIASYPCFEYWLLLHFIYSRKAYVRAGNRSQGDMMIVDLKKHPGMEDYDKGSRTSIFSKLSAQQLVDARARAAQALADAVATSALNPSTSIHHLVDYIEGLSTPIPMKTGQRGE